jgi:putative inorganic carbon (hco3(-)) transporter
VQTNENHLTNRLNVSEPTSFGFKLSILFLVLEYGRPQDMLSVIGSLHPALILTLIIFIVWLTSGKLRMAASPQTTRMVLFLFLLAAHVPFSVNNFRAFTVTQGFFLLFPLSISIMIFVDRIELLKSFMKWWALLIFYVSVNGIFGHGVAGSAFLNDENDFSLLMNLMLPFAICLFLYEQKTILKMAYVITALACVTSIVLSSSRGGLVGLMTVLVVIWFESPRKVLSLILVGILALGVYVVADQKYWDRMSTIENTDQGTAKERLESWQAGWDMFKDYPLGIGPGNFPVKFPEYQPESMSRNMWGRQAHSLWFTLLPELGIPGVLLYLSLLITNLRDILYLRRASKTRDTNNRRYIYYLSVAFMASLAGYFVSGSFISVLYYPHYWYLTGMIVATRKIINKIDKEDSEMQRGLVGIGKV